MTTHVELYEALKPHVGEAAAEMIAEIVPPATDLATKTDVFAVKSDFAELRAEFAQLRSETRAGLADLKAEIHAAEARTAHKLLTYLIPLWVTMASMAVAIVGLVATKL